MEAQMEQYTELGQALSQGSLLDSISHFVGGGREATKRTLDAALPASMLGIAEHGSTEAGAHALLDGLQSGKAPQLDIKDLGQTLANPDASDRLLARSAPVLERVFGGRLSGLLNSLSQYGGSGQGPSSRILGLCAPLALGMISRRAQKDHLDAGGLARFLRTQSPALAEQVPGPLRSLFGRHEQPAAEAKPTPSHPLRLTEEVPHREDRRYAVMTERRQKFWPYALLGLAALVGIFWAIGRGCTSRTQRAAAPATPTVQNPSVPPAQKPPETQPAAPQETAPPAQEPGARQEVGGAEKPAPELSSDSAGINQLSAYFAHEETAPKRVVLDGLSFDLGQTRPTAGGERVTDDLAALMVAHPNAKVRLEAFTDSSGSAELNQKLSQERADAVKSELIEKGVAADRIEATGMGNKNPVASDDTQEGKEQNRRIEAVVSGG
jgi:outer membrane protein OmpA-like peptidoglycan-associated protein